MRRGRDQTDRKNRADFSRGAAREPGSGQGTGKRKVAGDFRHYSLGRRDCRCNYVDSVEPFRLRTGAIADAERYCNAEPDARADINADSSADAYGDGNNNNIRQRSESGIRHERRRQGAAYGDGVPAGSRSEGDLEKYGRGDLLGRSGRRCDRGRFRVEQRDRRMRRSGGGMQGLGPAIKSVKPNRQNQ